MAELSPEGEWRATNKALKEMEEILGPDARTYLFAKAVCSTLWGSAALISNSILDVRERRGYNGDSD